MVGVWMPSKPVKLEQHVFSWQQGGVNKVLMQNAAQSRVDCSRMLIVVVSLLLLAYIISVNKSVSPLPSHKVGDQGREGPFKPVFRKLFRPRAAFGAKIFDGPQLFTKQKISLRGKYQVEFSTSNERFNGR